MTDSAFERLRDLRLRDYRPRAALRRPLTDVPRAAVPAVDAHNHLGRWLTEGWASIDVGALLGVMDAANVAAVVNLDGMSGEELEANIERYDAAHPGRFATFAQWDRTLFSRDAWRRARFAGRRLRPARCQRAEGLEGPRPASARRAGRARHARRHPPRSPVWDACASAAIPVTIHVADPIAFFDPLDEANERVEELLVNPDWWFGDRSRFPEFDRVLDALEGLIARRADVTFIGAHLLCCSEDLAWVGRMLDTYPNAHADIAARISELGRVAPRGAPARDRRTPTGSLFGTDAFPPDGDVYATHFRFLETADEHFPYDPWDDEPPGQGRWAISGLDLPRDVLEMVYAKNARRLIPGLA